MESYIDKLRELTGALPPVYSYVDQKIGAKISYKVTGTCTGEGLIHQPEVAVQSAYMSKGSTFPDHKHAETEIIIVWSGDLYYKTLLKEGIIRSGETVIFIPGELHSVNAFTDVHMIGITIPASDIYPEAGESSHDRKS